MSPLLEVVFALERVTLPVVTFCAPSVSDPAGLAGVTVLLAEEDVLLEGVVAVLLEAVLEEVLALEEPVFTCLLAVVPVEAELLPVLLEVELEEVAVLRLVEVPVLLEAEVELPLVRRFWLEEEVAGVAVLLDGAVAVVADLLSEELVLLLVEVVVLRLA